MVAPADPRGINKAGAPRSLNYSIDSWGFVHGRYDRRRKLLGWTIAVGGAVGLVLAAWLLTRLGGDNFHETTAGEWYRGAQMSESQLAARIRENDIRSVLRLVGTEDSNREDYESDVAATDATGAELLVAKLPTSRLPYRSELATLFEQLDRIARDASLRPVLVHCKQGSDRTGLVTVIWLHDYRGMALEQAREQLAFFPYMHFAAGHADAMGEFLNRYEAYAQKNPGASIKGWVRSYYFEEKPGRR
jgi:hypothetical protein